MFNKILSGQTQKSENLHCELLELITKIRKSLPRYRIFLFEVTATVIQFFAEN